MLCPKCGKDNIPGAVFCETCGDKLRPAPSTAVPQSANKDSRETVDILLAIPGKTRTLMITGMYLLSMAGVFALIVWGYKTMESTDEYVSSTIPAVVMVGIIFFAIICLVILNILEKNAAERDQVATLMHPIKGGFLLAEEGIYTYRRYRAFSRHRYYNFHFWGALRIYEVDDRKKTIILQDGRELLKLRALKNYKDHVDYYGMMNDIILSHLPPGKSNIPDRRIGYNWKLAGGLIIGLLLLDSLAASHLESISNSPVGDGLCDVNSHAPFGYIVARVSLLDVGTIPDLTKGTLAHEYCLGHGLLHALIRPDITAATAWPRLTAAHRNGDTGTAFHENPICAVFIVCVFIWGFVILVLLAIGARSWGRVKRLTSLWQ